MKLRQGVFLLSVGAGLVAAAWSRDAAACGGCFHVEQSRNPTQVTSHRMAFSVSQAQTTLWDQIEYVGEPSEFAWVLPIQGVVEVGLSSDLLFSQLDAVTRVSVTSPSVMCALPGGSSGAGSSPCPNATSTSATTGTGQGYMDVQQGDDPVEVLAQAVVGPYETVQLSSTDPLALQQWLEAHGYAIPPDVAPIVDAYVTEGFDFLALRLVPGQGVDAMRPIRVTTPGAGLSLPLRMVSAGTGAMTAITLFVLGEGRYQPANMPVGVINSGLLVWDFETSSSNYTTLRADFFDTFGGNAWLREAAFPIGNWELMPVTSTAMNDPANSGYGGPNGEGAYEEAVADVDTLLAGIDPASVSITRLYGELSKEALTTDLTLQANQAIVDNHLLAPAYVGDPCAQVAQDCHGGATSSGTGAAGAGGYGYGGGGSFEDGGDAGCACSTERPDDSTSVMQWIALAAAGLLGGRARRRPD